MRGLGLLIALTAIPLQEAPKHRSNHSSRRANGSARILTGRVCFYQVFVSDADTSWPEKARERARACVKSSVGFIAKEAKKYGADVTFVQEVGKDVAFASEIPKDMFAPPAWTEKVVRASSGSSGNDLVSRLKKERKADHVLILLHVNKSALSYNLTWYGKGFNPTWRAERVVLFTRYPKGKDTVCATYVHEILHGFGSGELYFPFDQTDERKKKAKKLFPNDVMFRVDPKLNRLSIGEWTAYRVGWTESLNPDHRAFEDPDR